MSRRRFKWDSEAKTMVEVTPDWTPMPRTELMTGACYDGLRATDGTPIDTRAKHREYMRLNGFTTTDDYKESWDKAAKERAAYFTEGKDPQRREAIGRAFYEIEKRGRR